MYKKYYLWFSMGFHHPHRQRCSTKFHHAQPQSTKIHQVQYITSRPTEFVIMEFIPKNKFIYTSNSNPIRSRDSCKDRISFSLTIGIAVCNLYRFGILFIKFFHDAGSLDKISGCKSILSDN